MDVSIIFVNYKTPEMTVRAIRAAQASAAGLSHEILVVDNGSGDGSVSHIREACPEVKLIESKENLGFSGGNNLALREAKGRYLLLLNTDIVVHGGAIAKSAAYMDEHPDAGILGGQVLLPDGRLDHACHRGFPTPQASLYYFSGMARRRPHDPRYTGYTLSHLPQDTTHPVDTVMGAYMMIRRDVMEQIGLLDEDYFMYSEDVDYCYRAKKAGWDIIYYHEAVSTHYKYGSRGKRRTKTIQDFYDSMWIFYQKHYRERYPLPVTIVVYLGIRIKRMSALLANALRSGRQTGHNGGTK